MDSSLGRRDRVPASFPITFEVGAKRAHDSLYGTRSPPRLLAVPQNRKCSPVFAHSRKRDTVEVIAVLAIAFNRSGIISHQEICMRSARSYVWIRLWRGQTGTTPIA